VLIGSDGAVLGGKPEERPLEGSCIASLKVAFFNADAAGAMAEDRSRPTFHGLGEEVFSASTGFAEVVGAAKPKEVPPNTLGPASWRFAFLSNDAEGATAGDWSSPTSDICAVPVLFGLFGFVEVVEAGKPKEDPPSTLGRASWKDAFFNIDVAGAMVED
jgi:hypothetical protein